MRYFAALLIGLIAALALFWGMERMIASDGSVKTAEVRSTTLDFVRVDREKTAPKQKKRLPPEPKPLSEPPKQVPQTQAQSATQPQPLMAVPQLPALTHRADFASGPKLSVPAMRGDAELTPLVRINPQYPPNLRRMRIEGHVKARLKVDEAGKVETITIIESVPEGRFDRSVRRALKRWKFSPKIEDGKAIAYSGVVTITFKLQK